MNMPGIFDSESVLPTDALSRREKILLGFEDRYARIHRQLRLLLNIGELDAWNAKYHHGKLSLCGLVAEQYPLVIFHGDVGTGKTATAECVANRLVSDARASDSMMFKLSNRVRGNGMVGEMSTQISEAFRRIASSIGKTRRAILIIDEGDSIAASRTQHHSHHEDKVAVNTLIQGVDELRQYSGRIVVILCTNRLSSLDPALRRRAAITETFDRPSAAERQQLFEMDLIGLMLKPSQIAELTQLTGAREQSPPWTYSDIRSRLYPAALAVAYPERPLKFSDLVAAASTLYASPILKDE